jgi:methyl-accepting chemotaxis protein
MNLAESIASPVLEKNVTAVRQELFKYAAQEDVAYVFVEDEKGNTLAATSERPHSAEGGSIFEPSPRFSRWATVSYRGKTVNESRAGILDGKLGIVHLGIWTTAVEKEIRRIFWPIALAIFLVVIIGVMTFSLAIRGISRLLLQLAQSANRISEGQLDTSSWINRRDEVGKLAISLERIRASLMAATKRLDPTQSARPKPANEAPQLSSPRP